MIFNLSKSDTNSKKWSKDDLGLSMKGLGLDPTQPTQATQATQGSYSYGFGLEKISEESGLKMSPGTTVKGMPGSQQCSPDLGGPPKKRTKRRSELTEMPLQWSSRGEFSVPLTVMSMPFLRGSSLAFFHKALTLALSLGSSVFQMSMPHLMRSQLSFPYFWCR